jgi:endonuclease YncB( thermonuclease family)
MTKLLSYVLFLMVALSIPATASDLLKARVVNVITGDILIVSIHHRAEVVHLYGVECPERGQAGWLKARNYTEQMVLYKQIVVEPVGAKRAGTIQAKVYVGATCINDALADVLFALKQGKDQS